MKQTLLDLFTSKKFLAALTAVIIYVAGRFGFDLDPAVLDRIFAAFLVYVGAQGVADVGKSAAQVNAVSTSAPGSIEAQAAVKRIASTLGVAALIALGGVALASTTACTGVEKAGTAIVDCTKANQASIEALILEFRSLLAGQAPDWAAVEARAISAGETIGGCALAELISGSARPATARSVDPGRATLEDFRARVAGGATFRTARGDL